MLRPDPLDRRGEPRPDHPVADDLAQAMPTQRSEVAVFARRWLLRLAPVVLLVAAGVVLWREFHHLSLSAVAASMDDWGHARIVAALLLSIFSFVLMGVVEWFGVRWVGAKIPWGPVFTASFLANAIAHSVGANLLVSGAVRARLYDRYQVSLTQVAAATLFGGVSFAVGLAALGGAGLLLSGSHEIAITAIPVPIARAAGAVLVTAALGYVALCAVRRAPLRAFGHTMTLPSVSAAAAQLILGVVDNGVAAAIIWILLPPYAIPYPTFVGAYAAAAVAGLISTVPAGAGVFEGSISTLLPNTDAAPLAAAFVGYRLAYYILPLVIASVALAGDTVMRARKRMAG